MYTPSTAVLEDNLAHTVTVYNFGRFENKLVALNKKARKFGLGEITVSSVQEETKYVVNSLGEKTEVFSHFDVTLQLPAESLVLPGSHKLVGVIDHAEKLVRSVPGSEVELRPYVERGAVCDHCGHDRNRKETFVILSEGKLVQVGRQCVGAYLGISPERALGQIEVVREVLEDEDWLGDRQIRGTRLGFYLKHVACLIRVAGWRSRSQAHAEGVSATADLAYYNISNEETRKRDRYGKPLWETPTAEDGELAEKTVEWLVGLQQRGGLNDYLSNLRQIGENGFVTDKSSGFAASAVVAYSKEVEEEVKRAARKAQEKAEGVGAEYLGAVKQRRAFEGLRLVKSPGFDTAYGYSFIHKFVDAEGHVVVWKTAQALTLGNTYNLVGTVKAHEEYRGELQTVITNVPSGKIVRVD